MQHAKIKKFLTALLMLAVGFTLAAMSAFADDVTVTSEEELQKALAEVTGTADAPGTITLANDITVTQPLAYNNKFIVLQGGGNGATLTANIPENNTLLTVGTESDAGNRENPTSGLTLRNITIDMAQQGRAIFEYKCVVNMESGSTIRNAALTESNDGAAVYLGTGATLNIYSGAVIEKCSARRGAAVCMWPDGNLNIYGGLITQNSSTSWGGAVWNGGNHGKVYMEGGTVSENIVGDRGAIGIQSGSSCIVNSKNETDPVRIVNNAAKGNDAWRSGICGEGGSTLSIRGAYFSGNTAEQGQASAVAWFGASGNGFTNGSCVIENCTFVNNGVPALRFAGQVTMGGNVMDDSQMVYLGGAGSAPLKLSAPIQENTKMTIRYNQNSEIADGITIVQGEGYILTENDRDKITLEWDLNYNIIALYLDTNDNALKTTSAVQVTFKSGNAADETFVQQVPSNVATRLRANPFVYNGYAFTGWKVENGDQTYADRETVTLTDSLTLVAQWTPVTYTLDAIEPQTYTGSAIQPELVVRGDGVPVDAAAYSVTYTDNTHVGTASLKVEIYGNKLQGTFAIQPAAIIITPNSYEIEQGAAMPTAFDYKVEGLLGADELLTPPTLTCAAADSSKPGNYAITASGADAGADYTIEYLPGTLTVKQAAPVTPAQTATPTPAPAVTAAPSATAAPAPTATPAPAVQTATIPQTADTMPLVGVCVVFFAAMLGMAVTVAKKHK